MISFVINPSSGRKKFYKRSIGLVLLCVILIHSLSGCFQGESAEEIKHPDFEVTENRKNELVFDVSLEEFIVCYNAFYQKDKHSDYLLPASQWSRETYDNAIHSSHPTVYYEFS